MKIKLFFCIAILISSMIACDSSQTSDKNSQDLQTDSTTQNQGILLNLAKASNFQEEIDGKQTDLYTLKNTDGMTATITNYGGRVVNLFVKDKEGEFKDVVLGFDRLSDYISAKERYLGANVGRYGNRIAKGKFTLDGKIYTLATNNGENHLHGGNKGFQDMVWDANQLDESTLELKYVSKDGEEGYPGNLEVKITYEITHDNALKVLFEANTDQKTICNLTHHSFFNLNGVQDTSHVNNHILKIDADRYTPVDETLIPTGALAEVDGTPFDFRKPTAIGARVNDDHKQLRFGHGYDHNFVLNNLGDTTIHLQATVLSPQTGIFMEMASDQPGVQLYGGNFLDGKTQGKGKTPYLFRSAFCLEPQHFPDSPNQPDFPSVVLEPGQKYYNIIFYKFSTQ